MTLSPPFDILADWPGWSTAFTPLWRQEQSRQANGVTRLKDYDDPLWTATFTTKTLTRHDLDVQRAILNRLGNGKFPFKGYNLNRTWPMSYPRGTWPAGGSFSGDTAAIDTIGDDNASLKLSGLPAGFVLAVGDFIRVGTADLYQVQGPATADSFGKTGLFDVFPNIWAGTLTGASVSVKRPYCLMTMVPGSLSDGVALNGLGSISFNAIEYR